MIFILERGLEGAVKRFDLWCLGARSVIIFVDWNNFVGTRKKKFRYQMVAFNLVSICICTLVYYEGKMPGVLF